MDETTPLAELPDFGRRATTEALIGTLRMSAEAGTAVVFRVEYEGKDGRTHVSPYGLYLSDDRSQLVMQTGMPGRETFAIVKTAITAVKLTGARDVVRWLNDLAPWISLGQVGVQVGQTAVASLLEAQCQSIRLFWLPVLFRFGGAPSRTRSGSTGCCSSD